MDALDKLIEDQKSLKRIEEAGKGEIKQRNIKIPDAIVLIKRIFTCKGCGEIYEIPNHRVLFRFRKNLIKIKFWIDYFNSSLKREVKEFKEEIETCEKCFKGRFFSHEDFDLERK